MNRSRLISKRAAAFTLIELLVVIAIIALLISILLPSLSAARNQGKRMKSLANLHGIGSAATAYSVDDPLDFLLPVPIYYGEDPFGYDGFYDWGGMTGCYDDNINGGGEWGWGPSSRRTADVRPMNTYLLGLSGMTKDAKGLELYKAPGDTGWAEAPFYATGSWASEWKTRPFWQSVGTSYRANCARAGSATTTWSMSPYFRPATRMEAVSDVILFMESIMWLARWNTEEQQGAGNGATIPGWHGKLGKFNVVFVDGHSATVKLDKYGLDPEPPDSMDPGYSQLWTRGPGPERWRMDTRREPLIQTLP
ncbi:MAG: prepilin-type N-terminal cleavage/methylation domain-containing protein [Planctomycetota bacterium]|nr:prepilin-type N-terminal cleavage/methylation domain-containing protein [Planctomycetota bacterium]